MRRNVDKTKEKGTDVPCEAILFLLTVLCLTINKIARCSLQAWEQSMISERGLLCVWVFLWYVMAVKYRLVSCVPPAPLSSCQPLSRYTSCAGLLQKKIKSYLSVRSHQRQALIVKTQPLYVGPCLGIMLRLPDTCSAPATASGHKSPVCFSDDSCQCRSSGGRDHSNPLWSHLTICWE